MIRTPAGHGTILALFCCVLLGCKGNVNDTVTASVFTILVSSSVSQDLPNESSSNPGISVDGRHVVFQSAATNLTANFMPSFSGQVAEQVFLKDVLTRKITMVSVTSTGDGGNNESGSPSVSDNGRHVAFTSTATDLTVDVVGNPGYYNVFVRDMVLGKTTLVSIDAETTDVSSGPARISSDGRYIVFGTNDINIGPGDTNGSVTDIIRCDRGAPQNGGFADTNLVFEIVSVDSNETQGASASQSPSMSPDGNLVVFQTKNTLEATDTGTYMDIYLRNISAGTTTHVSLVDANTEVEDDADYPGLSEDGRFVVFQAGLISTAWDPNMAPPGVGGYGPYIFLRDLQDQTVTLVSVNATGAGYPNNSCYFHSGGGGGVSPTISRDGRFVVFNTSSTNITSDVMSVSDLVINVFRYDRLSGLNTLVSIASGGKVLGNFHSENEAISGDGRYVIFKSWASTFVQNDINDKSDIFRRGP